MSVKARPVSMPIHSVASALILERSISRQQRAGDIMHKRFFCSIGSFGIGGLMNLHVDCGIMLKFCDSVDVMRNNLCSSLYDFNSNKISWAPFHRHSLPSAVRFSRPLVMVRK